MCRGGGEGVGTASLAPFGSLDHLALDWHDYFNGGSGGFDAAGDNWVPSWRDTHNQASPSYTGTESSQARVLRVPLARTRALGIPLLVGEWGVHTGAPGSAAYQTQMLDLFGKEGVSWDALGALDQRRLRPPQQGPLADARGGSADERAAADGHVVSTAWMGAA